MQCGQCGHDNSAYAKFCEACGVPLGGVCTECGHPLSSDANFCPECGAVLHVDGPSPEAHIPPHLREKILAGHGQLEGERKQVTVLFADVRGSMDLQEDLDPEEWRTIMDGFYGVLSNGVHRYEGVVNTFTGDGIMALFGAPIAHEDHAQRACHAALQLRADVARYADELRASKSLEFAVRLGLNSGEVVVGGIGDDLRMEYTALGHTVGLAQRMEAAADPGTVYVTAHTAHLVAGFFELNDLGAQDIKGVHAPLHVFELQAVGRARTHLDVAQARGLSRFVGREGEMQTLRTALERTKRGDGCVVGVVALAGTGKSRLCYEFTEQCRAEGLPVHEAYGVAHGTDSPYLPMLEFLRNFHGITERDTPEQARAKITDLLLRIDPQLDDALPLMFEFLAVPDPERPAPRMDPEARQRHLFGLVQRVTQGARAPGVIFLEDLHWFDDASRGMLASLIEAVAGSKALVLVSFRPEFEADWTRQSIYQQVALGPLDAEATTALLDDLLGQDPSLSGVPQLIRDRTGGNPFFLEEAVQDLAEHGGLVGAKGAYTLTRPIEELTIPATVQAVLDARIDRLPDTQKQVLQTAAVIGRTFPATVLQRVSEDAAEMDAALHGLIAAEFLYTTAHYPDAEYTFKHAVTQQVAYHSQLTDRRQRIHAAVAQAIEALYPDDLDERAAVIATHYEAAGEHLPAAQWHRRAALWSGISDIPAALHHWRQVHVQVSGLPETPDTVGLVLEACGQLLNWGFRIAMSVEEASGLFERGKELATRLNDTFALAFLHGVYGAVRMHTEGNVRAYVELTEEAARILEEGGSPWRGWSDAFSLFAIGRLDDALAAAQGNMELTREDPNFGVELVGYSLHVQALFHAAYHLALTGRLADGERLCREALDIGHELGETESLGFGVGYLAAVKALQGAAEAALAHGREGINIAETIGSPHSWVVARGWLAYGYWAARDWENLTAVLEEVIRISRRDRLSRENEAEYLAFLAQGYLGAGDLERARATADEAVAMAVDRGVKFQECHARYALARVLLQTQGADAREQIQATLDRGLALVEETGGAIMEPFLRMELAELAGLTVDPAARESELRHAQRLFTEMGAPIRAEQVQGLLDEAAVPGDSRD